MKQSDNNLRGYLRVTKTFRYLRVTKTFYAQRALLEPADKLCFNRSRQPFACINLDACRQCMSEILVWCTPSFWRRHKVARIHIDNLNEFAPQIPTKTFSMHVLVAANISRVQVDTHLWLTCPFSSAIVNADARMSVRRSLMRAKIHYWCSYWNSYSIFMSTITYWTFKFFF